MRKELAFLCVAFFCSFAALGTDAFNARLEPSDVPVGIPPALILRVENSAPLPLNVPRYFMISATSPGGDSFDIGLPLEPGIGSIPAEYRDSELIVGRGASFETYIPLGRSLAEAGFFKDERLHVPGKWEFTFIFDDRLRPEGQRIDDPSITIRGVALTVSSRPLDDALWAEMIRLTDGAGLSKVTPAKQRAVARQLLERFPGSSYESDLLLAAGQDSYEDAARVAEEVLKSNSRPWIHDMALEALAEIAAIRGIEAMSTSSETEQQEATAASRSFAKLANEGRTDLGRRKGRARLAQIEMRTQ